MKPIIVNELDFRFDDEDFYTEGFFSEELNFKSEECNEAEFGQCLRIRENGLTTC